MHFGIRRRHQQRRCTTSNIDLTKLSRRNPPSDRTCREGDFYCWLQPSTVVVPPPSMRDRKTGDWFNPIIGVDLGIAPVLVAIEPCLIEPRWLQRFRESYVTTVLPGRSSWNRVTVQSSLATAIGAI
jgi:hypothetical protein